MAKPGSDTGHDPALDGLRGIAILLVLVMHTMHFASTQPAWAAINAVGAAGWIGVDLFFVLSGFLITRVLLDLQPARNRLAVFYGRRALRILPGYFVTLLVAVPLVLWFSPPHIAALMRDSLPWFLVFGQNFYGAWSPPGDGWLPVAQLWSLAVEEQFYLLWPLLVWGLRRQKLARMSLALAAVAVACKLVMVLIDAPLQAPYVLPFTRMDCLTAGAFLAVRQRASPQENSAWPLRLLPWLAAALMTLTLIANRDGWPRSIGIMAICTSLTPWIFMGVLHSVLGASAHSPLRRALSVRPLLFFGRHSYALYLVHPAGIILQSQWLPHMNTLWPGNAGRLLPMALAWLVAIALALLMDRCVDQPLRGLRRHFQPRFAAQSAAHAPNHAPNSDGLSRQPAPTSSARLP